MDQKQAELFAAAPVPPPRRPVEPILRSALVEPPYRFWLKRAWGAGPMCAWAMLNPSVADGSKDDPTMLRVMEFSLRWGFGSCVVVNLYPFITPLPAEMKAWRAKVLMTGPGTNPETEAWFDNVDHCARELSAAARRVAAWGNNADGQDLSWWLESIAWQRANCGMKSDSEVPAIDPGAPIGDWLCLGTTTSGAPKHPLARGAHRVPPDFEPVPWRAP